MSKFTRLQKLKKERKMKYMDYYYMMTRFLRFWLADTLETKSDGDIERFTVQIHVILTGSDVTQYSVVEGCVGHTHTATQIHIVTPILRQSIEVLLKWMEIEGMDLKIEYFEPTAIVNIVESNVKFKWRSYNMTPQAISLSSGQ